MNSARNVLIASLATGGGLLNVGQFDATNASAEGIHEHGFGNEPQLIAEQIAQLGNLVVEGNTIVKQISSIDGAESAAVSFSSTDQVNGQPDPDSVNKLNICVSLINATPNTPEQEPVIDISMKKHRGKWVATETIGLASTATSTISIGSKGKVTKKTVVSGRSVKSSTTNSKRIKNAEIKTITRDAKNVLGFLAHGNLVYVNVNQNNKSHKIITS